MSILTARPLSKRKNLKQVVFPTGRVLLWISVLVLTTSIAQFAHGQTFVNQQTTTTLWGGIQDITVSGPGGFTLPGSGVILQGTAISAFTGQPVRHLWYGDAVDGICRVDPEIDQPLATPVNGFGSFNVNVLTCLSSLSALAITPGQLAFDASTNTLYTVDARTASILRLHYIPSGDNGQGSLDLVNAEVLLGTSNRSSPFGPCPQLRDPKTSILVPDVPSSIALGPDGNLYAGSIRDGAIIRIVSPATFNPQTDCANAGDTGQSPTGKIQIPILSADERFGAGHTFGMGWIGHTLFGADNIAPWLLLNADTCLTAANGNNTCGNPVVGGAPLPTEFLATQVAGPQGGAASDAVYPNNPGTAMYFATFPSLTMVTNVTSATSMTVNLNYGGSFSFITGITPDPQNPNVVYVGADPCQGCINGDGQIWKVTLLPERPPNAPTVTSAKAGPGTGQATVSWAPFVNGQPILTYNIQILLASPTGGAPIPSGLPDVTIASPATTTTISGLTVGTTYVFEVQECNSIGCSAFSSPSSPVTAFEVMPAPAPINVVAVDLGSGNSAAVSWTQAGNGNSPIISSTITAFLNGVTAVSSTTILGTGTGATVTGLTCGSSYTFTVTATNAVGTSPASAPSALITITCPVNADVSVQESAPGIANPGTQVTYTINIHNSGPASAPSVTFSETLPAPLVAFTTTQGACFGTASQTLFSCNLGSMPSGANATVTVTVLLPSNVTGTFTNVVTVNATNTSGANIDPNLANNTASATVNDISECPATTTDVQVTGSSNNGNPVHGTPVTFTWQIKNNQGTVAANCSTFIANTTAPTGATLTINSASTTQGTCSIVNNQLSCSLGFTLGGGSTATVTVVATPSNAEPANSYTMTGLANFIGTDTNTANNSSTVLIGAQ